MRTLPYVCLLLLLHSGSVVAQTGVPTSWNLRIYNAGSATASSNLPVTTAQVQCGQSKMTGGALNVTVWRWDDPADPTKDCVYTDARLTALPDGSYEGTAQAVNADGSSAETARVPFTRRRPNPPPVPTGLKFTN